MPLNIIMALAFSAAAAAAIRLLFSASDKSGDRKRKEGSIHGDGNPKESLKINKNIVVNNIIQKVFQTFFTFMLHR